MTNPSRITVAQDKAVRFDPESRFVPIAATSSTKYPCRGFIVLRDTTPGEEIAYVDLKFKPQSPPQPVEAADDNEPAPPEDFEFDPDDDERGY